MTNRSLPYRQFRKKHYIFVTIFIFATLLMV